MTDRDRLIELKREAINYAQEKADERGGLVCIDDEVDYLLENGVIVPPCKVGQTVYTRYGYSFKIQRIEVLEDKKILFRCGNDGTDDYMAFYDFEIGTEVFLTKEESEAKLKELNKNGNS